MVSLKYRVSGAFKLDLQMLSLKGWNLPGASPAYHVLHHIVQYRVGRASLKPHSPGKSYLFYCIPHKVENSKIT